MRKRHALARHAQNYLIAAINFDQNDKAHVVIGDLIGHLIINSFVEPDYAIPTLVGMTARLSLFTQNDKARVGTCAFKSYA
jgi:hypothetical protein